MIKGLDHVVMYCTDAEASRAWYDAAGFEYLRGQHGMHWFALGTSEVMLHPSTEGPAGHSQNLAAAVTDIDAQFAAAVAKGLTPFDHQQPGVHLTKPITRPWGDRVFELTDPNGYIWSFVQR